MFEYLGYRELNDFYTIQEACNIWNMDKEELRSICERYDLELERNKSGIWGFNKSAFRVLNNFLYMEQCRDGEDDIKMWLQWVLGTHETTE